jgi:16S rRNA (uracil1498-N3)-methyltransferase
VLRLRVGDVVELFDGRGRTSAASIESITERTTCVAQPPTTAEAPSTAIVLLLAIPKGATLDQCVRMATELGVARIALFQAERSVPRWDSKRAASRIDRLTRIAAEASSQSERADIPRIEGPKSLASWLDTIPAAASRVVFGARATEPLELTGAAQQVWCAIGAEGGFSEAELDTFARAGFAVVSLGPRVLRVDTAVAAGLSLVQNHLRPAQAR